METVKTEIQIESKITFRWWSDEIDQIKESNKDYLHNHAINHIKKMVEMGFQRGELIAEIEENGDFIPVNGWWWFKTQ